MTLNSIDAIISSTTQYGGMQKLLYQKLLPSTTVVNVPHTLWHATGLPTSGSNPVVGTGGAVVCTGGMLGSLAYVNPTGAGNNMYLVGLGGTPLAGGPGTLIMVDRLAHAQVSIVTSGAFSPIIDGSSRLGNTEGGQIIMEVTAGFAATTNNLQFRYINQVGATGTTPLVTTVASCIYDRVPYANYFTVPLSGADTGVRAITNWYSYGVCTGSCNIVLARMLAFLPLPVLDYWTDRDYVVELPSLPQIKNNSCLAFYFIPNTAGTNAQLSEVRLVEG